MTLIKMEIESNFDSFTSRWKDELPKAIEALDSRRNEFLASYSRIASMNAWRAYIFDDSISTGSLEFFVEAVNDALVSHLLARMGSFRSALMSLRSCIENTCYCLYYKDHPVELKLWDTGKHRPGFSEIHTYLKQHPDLAVLKDSPVTGLAIVDKEYGTLSRAVHASAKSFRMSPSIKEVMFWKTDAANFGGWQTREKLVLYGLNLLLTALYRDLLQGAQQQSLRKALGVVIPTSSHSEIKKKLKVTIRPA